MRVNKKKINQMINKVAKLNNKVNKMLIKILDKKKKKNFKMMKIVKMQRNQMWKFHLILQPSNLNKNNNNRINKLRIQVIIK